VWGCRCFRNINIVQVAATSEKINNMALGGDHVHGSGLQVPHLTIRLQPYNDSRLSFHSTVPNM
jgi:hypothetical protein